MTAENTDFQFLKFQEKSDHQFFAWYLKYRTVVGIILLFASAIAVQAQFNYTTTNGTVTILGYTGSGPDLLIPDTINGLPVTDIRNFAFADREFLTNVTIGETVTNIGYQVFADCTSLTAITVAKQNLFYSSSDGVLFNKDQTTLFQYPLGRNRNYTIPNGVTNIADFAFQYCTDLASITIPHSVSSIGELAFYQCSGLTNLAVPGSVRSIGLMAFAECAGLTNVIIGNGATVIGIEEFALCEKLASVAIPDSVTNIGGGAFFSCRNLASIAIPDSVVNIGTAYFAMAEDGAFEGCSGLTNITIGRSVTNIGYEAFRGCTSLRNIIIPASVAELHGSAFLDCLSLTNITVDSLNANYSSLDGVLFDKNQSTLLQFPPGVAGACIIPNSVTSIGYGAFAHCHNLTGVFFLGDAPTADGNAFYGFDGETYVAPEEITTVYYLPGTTGWDNTFAGLSTSPWFLPNPLILNTADFGGQTHQFGFTVSWTTNASLVVEASTNLANPVWIPLATNNLAGGSFHFSDPQRTNYPSRFYRVSGK